MTEVPSSGRQGPGQERYDDEISLVDLFLVLFRWKKLLVGIFLLCLLGGIGYALTTTHAQNYHTVIEIGTYSSDWESQTLESPEELQTYLREAQLPAVRRELAQEWGVDIREVPEVEIGVTDTPGELVWMRSQVSMDAPQDQTARVKEIHNALIARVTERHNERLEGYQERLEARLEQKVLELEKLEEEKGKALDKRQALFKEREEELQTLLTSLQPLEFDNLQELTDDNPLTMGRLLHGSLSIELRQELSRVQEEQLNIEEQQTSLEYEIGQKKQELRELRSQEREFQPTKALFVAAPEDIEGAGRSLIVALSAVLGFILGIFAPFVAEILSTARTESKRRQGVNE